MRKKILAVFLATLWIILSEVLRYEFLLKPYWINHYGEIGLSFPADLLNAAVWGIWALGLSIIIFIINRKFSLAATTLISWFSGFGLMYLVIGNMAVLPFGILPYAIPLSLLEVFIAGIIIQRMIPASNKT